MSLTNSYLTSTKNFDAIMNSILSARAPERFTNKFLEDLGFKSSNDRLITGVLKGVGFLSETGEPTPTVLCIFGSDAIKEDFSDWNSGGI